MTNQEIKNTILDEHNIKCLDRFYRDLISNIIDKVIGLKEKCLSPSLDLIEVEKIVQLLHSEDWEFGNTKKRCAELIENTRNKVGYTKEDVRIRLLNGV
jgi:hypothetical protein